MNQPQTYVSKPVVVQALQWTGDNLRAIQDFVVPQSPSYAPDQAVLMVRVPDKVSIEKYPSLGAQFKSELVPLHAWVIKQENGDLDVVTATEFAAGYAELAEDAENLQPAEQIRRSLGYRSAEDTDPGDAFGPVSSVITIDPIIVDPLAVVLLDRQPEVDAAGDVTERER